MNFSLIFIALSMLSNPVYTVPTNIAKTYSLQNGNITAKLFINATTGSENAAITLLKLKPEAKIATHTHKNSDEILFIRSGSLQMTIGNNTFTAGSEQVIFIPKNIPHSTMVVGDKTVEVIQVYAKPGPEQRFTKGKLLQ